MDSFIIIIIIIIICVKFIFGRRVSREFQWWTENFIENCKYRIIYQSLLILEMDSTSEIETVRNVSLQSSIL